MTKDFLQKAMRPQWMVYPSYGEFSMGWRMGGGEDYRYKFWDWYEKLTKEEQQAYQEAYPYPIFWHYNNWNDEQENEEADEQDEERYYGEGGVSFWQPYGAYKYSREELQHSDGKHEFIFFWQPDDKGVGSACLSQWQPSHFYVNAGEYTCAEQYMMAQKAALFEDEEVEKEILATTDPKTMKALGRKVRNFDERVWNKVKYSIVLAGNYYKFVQNEAMRDYLLSTGDKVLVEVSSYDKVWGIGLSAKDEYACNHKQWRGENLLGFALMEVRDELRRLGY